MERKRHKRRAQKRRRFSGDLHTSGKVEKSRSFLSTFFPAYESLAPKSAVSTFHWAEQIERRATLLDFFWTWASKSSLGFARSQSPSIKILELTTIIPPSKRPSVYIVARSAALRR